jgi:hypothetical protein
MNTIGGGTVMYVGVELLPCPEAPAHVGQVIGPARLDLVWHDRVVESFPLRVGDELLVADGADVAPGTALIARDDWRRSLRAAIPEGVEAVVKWSEPFTETVDEVTDMRRSGFASDRPVTVELLVDGATIASATMQHVTPIAAPGAVVRRGDRLAWITKARRMRDVDTSIETVRAFLGAHRLPRERTALVAPCDATVIEVDRRWIVLRTPEDRVLRLRHPPNTYPVVEIGDSVAAGDPLTGGERNHHALLHAWGEHRLAEHVMDELSLMFGNQVPRVYWSLALRAMLQGGKLRGIGALARARRGVR